MPANVEQWKELTAELGDDVTLVAVSKTKPVEDIQELYNLGQHDFGENYVQELVTKQSQLPHEIRWHFIGHLQSNKVKEIVPFVYLIQGVDSLKLLKEIQKQSIKAGVQTRILLQVHIAEEETKFGLDEQELEEIWESRAEYTAITCKGLMGMASNSDDTGKIKNEFEHLHSIYEKYRSMADTIWQFSVLSMGMSGDYKSAIEQGSTMVRIGSLLFGERNYT